NDLYEPVARQALTRSADIRRRRDELNRPLRADFKPVSDLRPGPPLVDDPRALRTRRIDLHPRFERDIFAAVERNRCQLINAVRRAELPGRIRRPPAYAQQENKQ